MACHLGSQATLKILRPMTNQWLASGQPGYLDECEIQLPIAPSLSGQDNVQILKHNVKILKTLLHPDGGFECREISGQVFAS